MNNLETKTFQNLMNAFAGESQARNRYTMYAKIAKKEGWNNISNVFLETAHNEYYHAKEFFNIMCEMVGEENMPAEMSLTASYPVAQKSTYDNLLFAAAGEEMEVDDYAEMAEVAREEGFKKAAVKFDLIAKVEAHHAERYNKLAALLKAEELVAKNDDVLWICDVCGHIHYGKRAPKLCPICSHGAGHFTLK